MTPKSGPIARWRARRADRAVQAADRREAVAAEEQARQERLRERLAQQLSTQWEHVREARRVGEPTIETGPSNTTRAQVPWALDMAAAWAWRFMIIAIAALAILWTLRFFAIVVLPVIVAVFIAALVAPVVALLKRIGLPEKLAALVVVLTGIASIALLLTFVGQQVANGVDNLSTQVVGGLQEIRDWLQTGPLHASNSQINDVIAKTQDFITQWGKDSVGKITQVGVALSHILAGFFIILFSTYFFLADGKQIWAWCVRLFPRAARERADSSGRVAWRSLTQFVRATVLVAGTDAIGVMIIAAILKVPLVSAIGVLVFLGAFVPLIGAFLSGGVAVLVALVAHGPIVALLMLGGVVLVQQIEAHVLQPFLMGRFVSVHPLGVILAIAAGVIVGGIAGALLAVPLAATLNAVVQHLASFTEVGDTPDPEASPSQDEHADEQVDEVADPA